MEKEKEVLSSHTLMVSSSQSVTSWGFFIIAFAEKVLTRFKEITEFFGNLIPRLS